MAGKDKPLSLNTGISQQHDIILTQADESALHVGALPPPNTSVEAPQSPQEKLERFLDNRPSPTELKQRNILKDSNVAPALQSAQAPLASKVFVLTVQLELQRKRLEDELSAKLSIRPTAEDLVDQHILSPDEVPAAEPPQSPQEKLTKFFQRRPSQHELEERNILKDVKVAPALQGAKAELEKAKLEDDLSKKLANRPIPEELIKEKILNPDEDPTKEPKD